MTVEITGVIDIITVDSSTDDVVLVISDHLPFEGNDEHLFVLQEKINTYLSFVESGEMLESFPTAKGRPIVITVICKFAPSHLAKKFFEKVEAIVREAGFSFSYQVTPEGK